MPGQRIGYIRVSSIDQKSERQLESVPVDRVFTDKVSGKDTKRPEYAWPLCQDHMVVRYRERV